MKKTILISILIFLYILFSLFNIVGTRAVIEFSSLMIGVIYSVMAFEFLKQRNKSKVIVISSVLLFLAGAFATLPLILFLVNKIIPVVNINYNDVLFNLNKGYVNSLIGNGLFLIAMMINSIIGIGNENIKAKNKFALTAFLAVMLAAVILVLLRKLGLHISFARLAMKISVIISVLAIIPYFLYQGYKSQLIFISILLFTLVFLIGIPVPYILSTDFSTTKWLKYDHPVRVISKNSLDSDKTLGSLKKITENFYSISFYGDYTIILEANNKKCAEESINTGYACSLFSAFGDSSQFLFGRNFDNPEGWKCKTLLCRTNPLNGYSSLSLVRMADFGIDLKEKIEDLKQSGKSKLLNAVFWPPDGINERGLVVALASVDAQKLDNKKGRAYINCTYLVREILDHAQNVDEAVKIISEYNVMNDYWTGSCDNHLLIADSSGRSVIAEVSKGKFEFTYNTNPWQVLTNSSTYGIDISSQKKMCPRLEYLTNSLEEMKGRPGTQRAMACLEKIAQTYTEWSVIYNITGKEALVVIDGNFNSPYHFSFTTPTNKR